MPTVETKLVIDDARVAADPQPERDLAPVGAAAVVEDPISKSDERREDAAFGSAVRPHVDPPPWFRELSRNRAAPEKVFDELVGRLPQLEDMRLVQSIVNEMGRLEMAADVVRRHLTAEMANLLHPKE